MLAGFRGKGLVCHRPLSVVRGPIAWWKGQMVVLNVVIPVCAPLELSGMSKAVDHVHR